MGPPGGGAIAACAGAAIHSIAAASAAAAHRQVLACVPLVRAPRTMATHCPLAVSFPQPDAGGTTAAGSTAHAGTVTVFAVQQPRLPASRCEIRPRRDHRRDRRQ